ncbi:MAG: hypothetical protein R3F17_06980 [Planctomycetota bacterium]
MPVFPIGGITELNAWQLAPVGRAAVASGILAQADPAHAAAAIRRALTQSRSQPPPPLLNCARAPELRRRAAHHIS